MFFEICKCPYNILFPFGQRYRIPNFKSIGPPVTLEQFFWVFSATNWQICAFIFFWPKIFVIYMCIKFGEDISFCSRAIIFFVNMALDFRTFWGPIAILSGNVNFFSIIIDIHFPENISAVVWIRSGKKPRTSSQKYVSDITQVCEKTGPRRPQITGGFFDFPWPKDSKYVKILSLRQAVWELLAHSRFFCCSAPYGPIWLRIWYVLLKLRATHWQSFKSLGLTVWAARCVLRRKRNNNNNKNPYNYNRDSALRARTPKYSCEQQ